MDEEVRYGKPEGKQGENILDDMDDHHTPVSLWALSNIEIEEDDVILDIGCGSGLNVKRLHKKSPKAKTYGLDYSSTSVKKSTETNNEFIDKNEVEIIQANVKDMPFEDETFDLITAFETVYFWPEITESFKEVKRILKTGGKFCIIMDANGLYCEEVKEIAKQENCIFYNDEQLKTHLLEAGYNNITSIIRQRKTSQKLIKEYNDNKYNEKLIDEPYDLDNYVEGEISGRVPTSPEWLCIISEN